MSSAWFYARELQAGDETLRLADREARHAVSARRLEAGAEITIFNGNGCWARARLEPDTGTVRVLEVFETPSPVPAIHLCAALPKGERLAMMLGMIAQLGVTSFTPLLCQRGVVRPNEKHRRRAERLFVEACKQSRNPWIPRWREPLRPAAAAANRPGSVFFADPGGRRLDLREKTSEFTFLVGPEGGFTRTEADALRETGAQPASLGNHILRIETAAVALAAMVRLGAPSL